jgi:hypothetical protein
MRIRGSGFRPCPGLFPVPVIEEHQDGIEDGVEVFYDIGGEESEDEDAVLLEKPVFVTVATPCLRIAEVLAPVNLDSQFGFGTKEIHFHCSGWAEGDREFCVHAEPSAEERAETGDFVLRWGMLCECAQDVRGNAKTNTRLPGAVKGPVRGAVRRGKSTPPSGRAPDELRTTIKNGCLVALAQRDYDAIRIPPHASCLSMLSAEQESCRS